MNRNARLIFISTALAAMVLQFTNCSEPGTAVTETGSSSQSSVTCTNATCINATVDNLKLTPHTGDENEYGVPAGLAEFNIAGDCNEGGFAYNTIFWELRDNGVAVRTSANVNANSRCVNGRFLLYINLAAITADNVNRTGLRKANGSRGPYDLYMEIYGQDQQGGAPQRSPRGRYTLPLLPL